MRVRRTAVKGLNSPKENFDFIFFKLLDKVHSFSYTIVIGEIMAKSNTRIYSIWLNMKRRCDDPKHKCYARYGGRGIKVCDEWYDSDVFIEWALSHGYDNKLTLDRIDNDGNYAPDNCRFVSMAEQNMNKSNTVLITYEGETHSLKEWADITKLSLSTLNYRYYKKWPVERMFGERQRCPRLITYKGKTQSLADWGREYNMIPEVIAHRIKKGHPLDKCFEKSVSKTYTIAGETHTINEWSEISGVPRTIISSRIYSGMPLERAVFQPAKKYKKSH